MYKLDDLVSLVAIWAKDKGILENSSPEKQMLKSVAEVGELADAVAVNDMDEIIDGIGDVMVTLIILAQLKGLTVRDCLNSAYQVISKRKGSMQNGIFVKES